MTRKEDIAYLAGLFDGEGCVYIASRNARDNRSFRHELRAVVKMINRAAMNKFSELFGGCQPKEQKSRDGHRPIYQWLVADKAAYLFLKKILKYSTVKKREIELALEFYELCFDSHRKGFGKEHKLKDHEIGNRETFKHELSALKWAGTERTSCSWPN